MSDEIREWASTVNYTGGADVGTPTKVDPGDALAAEGWRPGPLAAQHLNYLLNQLTALERDRHEGRVFEINEDFSGVLWDSSNAIIHADHVWSAPRTGSALVQVFHTNGTPQNPGEIQVWLTGDGANAGAIDIFLGNSTNYPTSFSTLDRAMVAVQNDQNDTNATDTLRFGLTSDLTSGNFGDNAVFVQREHDGNWTWRVHKSGVQTSDTLKTYVDFIYEVFEFVRLENGDVEIRNNGNLLHTVDSTDCPSGSCNLRLHASISSSDTEVHKVYFDCVKIRSRPGTRQD